MVKALAKLILIGPEEMLAVSRGMDAHCTNTDAGNNQRDEKRYSKIEFHREFLVMIGS